MYILLYGWWVQFWSLDHFQVQFVSPWEWWFVTIFFCISTNSKKSEGLLSFGHQKALKTYFSHSRIKTEAALLSHSGIKKPFAEASPGRANRPYFPLSLSILAGSNLIIYYILFFCNTRLIPKKIHHPCDFWGNSSLFDFRENPCKTPKENKKKLLFFFAPCVFWICSRVALLLCHWI